MQQHTGSICFRRCFKSGLDCRRFVSFGEEIARRSAGGEPCATIDWPAGANRVILRTADRCRMGPRAIGGLACEEVEREGCCGD